MKVRSTLKDVASLAGVSPTTVSLYLNGVNEVCSEETAGRIRDAVYQLQYTRGLKALTTMERHRMAEVSLAAVVEANSTGHPLPSLPMRTTSPGEEDKSLPSPPSGRSPRLVGVSLPTGKSAIEDTELSHPAMERFANEIWDGALEVALAARYRVLSFPAKQRHSTSPDVFTASSLAGLILEATNSARLDTLVASGMPIMLVDRCLDIPAGCGAVYPLEHDTVSIALQHLWEHGHRRIAYYGGPIHTPISAPSLLGSRANHSCCSDFATVRYGRYRAIMQEQQALDAMLSFCESDWDGGRATEILSLWRSLPDPPTAVFCASDSLAMALWSAAEGMGLSVPHHLSLVGVGNSPEWYRQGRPLTTVALPGREIGREAMHLLLRMVAGYPARSCRSAIVLSETDLIERGSVAVLPSSKM